MKHFQLKEMIILFISILTLMACQEQLPEHLAESGKPWKNVEGKMQEFPHLKNTFPTLDSAVSGMVHFLAAQTVDSTAKYVMQGPEYRAFYPFLNNGSTIEKDAGFVASLYLAGNKKHMYRWMGEFKRDGFVKLDSVSYEPLQVHKGFELHKIKSIYVTYKDGKSHPVEPFGSIIRTRDGFKIWSFLDT